MKDPSAYYISFLISILFLIGLGLNFSLLFKRDKKALVGIPEPVLWRWMDLALVITFFLFFQQVTSLLFQFILQTWTSLKIYKDVFIWFSNFIVALVSFLFLIRFLKIRYGVGLKELGIVFPVRLKWFGTGFLYYCSAIPVLMILGMITKIIGDFFSIPLEPQAPLKMLKQETSPFNLTLISIFVVVAAPFFEEIFFRGFVYPLMKKFLGFRWAMILSSVLFAMLHFSFLAFLPITCIGLFLAYLYEKTGSLFSSIVFHCLNNLMAVLIVIFVMK